MCSVQFKLTFYFERRHKMSKLDLRVIAKEEAPSAKKELTPRTLSFSISYESPDGDTFQDTLYSTIMDGDGRLTHQRVIQKLAQGMQFDNLAYAERLRIDALSRAVVQLKDAPEWVTTWIAQDDQLLADINNVLMEHESRYFRRSDSASEGNERKRRVSIDCALFAKNESPEQA